MFLFFSMENFGRSVDLKKYINKKSSLNSCFFASPFPPFNHLFIGFLETSPSQLFLGTGQFLQPGGGGAVDS